MIYNALPWNHNVTAESGEQGAKFKSIPDVILFTSMFAVCQMVTCIFITSRPSKGPWCSRQSMHYLILQVLGFFLFPVCFCLFNRQLWICHSCCYTWNHSRILSNAAILFTCIETHIDGSHTPWRIFMDPDISGLRSEVQDLAEENRGTAVVNNLPTRLQGLSDCRDQSQQNDPCKRGTFRSLTIFSLEKKTG